jgi:2-methylcitrate dehydratase
LFPFHLPDLIVVFKAWHDSLADRRIPKGESTMAQFVRQPISDPHAEEKRTAVQRIAAFAKAAHAKDLKPHIRQLYKRNILDSLGCAIAALPGCPFQSLRERFEEFRSPGRCTLIGGGKTSLDQAAFFNSALVRYVDLLDSYMSPGGLCHPSDNFGAVLAAAEQVGASGEQFLLALAVSYEIQCRFTAAVPVMAKGFSQRRSVACNTIQAARCYRHRDSGRSYTMVGGAYRSRW